MNKIIIVDNEIVVQEVSDKISVFFDKSLPVFNLNINVTGDVALTIEYRCKMMKLNVNIDVCGKCDIFEVKTGEMCKLAYNVNIREGELNFCKVNDVCEVLEQSIFYLNGKSSKVSYLLKTVSCFKEVYDVVVYHNADLTESNIVNNGVNIKEGELSFAVSGFVLKGSKKCIAIQNNRIINLTNNLCLIKPNLLIDENDVVASHSADIGKCSDDEMFYLMSRGISHKDAEYLVIKGFLSHGVNSDVIDGIVKKYWR